MTVKVEQVIFAESDPRSAHVSISIKIGAEKIWLANCFKVIQHANEAIEVRAVQTVIDKKECSLGAPNLVRGTSFSPGLLAKVEETILKKWRIEKAKRINIALCKLRWHHTSKDPARRLTTLEMESLTRQIY